MSHLSPKALGLSLGLTWVIGMLLLSLFNIMFGKGGEAINLISNFYLGYGTSVGGIVWGVIWGFVDGFVGGYVIGWLYNKFSKPTV